MKWELKIIELKITDKEMLHCNLLSLTTTEITPAALA